MILLYIDPGTGSMLFTILIGIAAAAVFSFQKLWLRCKYMFLGGRVKEETSGKIPYLIFSDHKRYWNVFRPVCDEFEKRGIAAEYWTASGDDPALEVPYKHVSARYIGSENKAFARLNMMKAQICLSTTPGLDVFQWKRSRDVEKYVHIFHSMDDGTLYQMFGLDYYDVILLNGAFQEGPIRELEEKRGLPPKETVVVGSTYMDSLQERAELIKGGDEINGGRKKDTLTVLLAPSWGESGIFSRFGEELIRALLDTECRLVIRPHPQSFLSEKDLMDALMEKFPESGRISWNRDNDNFRSLAEADILISDFSSVIFDFCLVFGKPVIYADTSFDPAPYDVAWLDAPLWKDSVLPRIGKELKKEDFSRLGTMIAELVSDDELGKGRAQVREEIWQNRGHAAEAVVDKLISMAGSDEKDEVVS